MFNTSVNKMFCNILVSAHFQHIYQIAEAVQAIESTSSG